MLAPVHEVPAMPYAIDTFLYPARHFSEELGQIKNIVEHPVGGVGTIYSKAGSTRARHYHKEDWHYLYVLTGEFYYYSRSVGDKTLPPPMVIREGHIVFTPPMREHLLVFVKDTMLLSLSRFGREHQQHESDVVRVEFGIPSIPKRLASDEPEKLA